MIPFACPNCHAPLQMPENWDYVQVDCPHCGKVADLRKGRDEHELRAGDRLLQFELLTLLGSGGNGAVWRAHDHTLDRDVAIKFPNSEVIEVKDRRRFLREASLAARVKHAHIVAILHVGEDPLTRRLLDGTTTTLPSRIYIVSELIVGRGLDALLNLGQRIPPANAAWLVERLADALGAAHQARVIHRDVKPSNVMLDADDAPHLLDFGVSKSFDPPNQTVSREGAVVGSPFYLSPEQARGENAALDERTDIYSLGVLFHELLTGRRPFEGTEKQVEHATADPKRDAPGPRHWVPTLPRDLDTICRRCLEKNRDKRFRHGAELAQELRRFREGLPIESRPISALERLVRWGHRKPGLAAVSGLLTLVTVAALGTTAMLNRRQATLQTKIQEKTTELATKDSLLRAKDIELRSEAKQLEQTEVERQKQAKEAARRKSEAYLNRYISDMRLAREYWASHELNNLKALLETHLPARTQLPDVRGFEWFYWWGLLHGDDVGPMTLNESFPLDHDILAAAFSADGQWLAVGARNRGLIIIRTQDGEVVMRNEECDNCSPLAMTPDGQLIATFAREDNSILVWNRSGRKVAQFTGLSYPVHALSFSPNRRYLASSGNDSGRRSMGEIVIWDIENAQPLHSLIDPRTQHLSRSGQTDALMQANTEGILFSPDNESLWTSGGRTNSPGHIPEHLLLRWSVRTGQLLDIPRSSNAPARALAVSHDQKTLWLSANEVVQWTPAPIAAPDMNTLDFVIPRNPQGLERRLSVGSTGALSLSPSGRWLVTATPSDEIVFIDAATGIPRQTFQGQAEVKSVVALNDDCALSVDRRGVIQEWKLGGNKAGERTQRFAQNLDRKNILGPFQSMRYADEELVAVEVDQGQGIGVCNVSKKQRHAVSLAPHNLVPRVVRLSEDGQRLLISGHDRVTQRKRIAALDYRNNMEVAVHPSDDETIKKSDGLTTTGWSGNKQRRLCVDPRTGEFQVQDAGTGQRICTLQFRDRFPQLRAIRLNQDGSWIYGLPSSAGAIVTAWNGETGEIAHEYRTRGIEFSCLALSPDGRRLAASGDVRLVDQGNVAEGGIRIWDASLHEEVLSLPTGSLIRDLQFSASGRQLAALSMIGEIVVWQAPASEEKH